MLKLLPAKRYFEAYAAFSEAASRQRKWRAMVLMRAGYVVPGNDERFPANAMCQWRKRETLIEH